MTSSEYHELLEASKYIDDPRERLQAQLEAFQKYCAALPPIEIPEPVKAAMARLNEK